MNKTLRRLSLGVCLLALAACGSEEREETFGSAVYEDLKAKYIDKPEEGAAPAARDLSWIETNTKPLIVVVIEETQGMGFLAYQANNKGYKTWRTSDDTSFIFRNGFLTGTKGLGQDLVSASVPSRAASSGSQARTHYYLDGDDNVVGQNFACNWKFVGSETTPVIIKTYQTKHYSESCESGELSFKNDYWLDSSGIIRQSRQYVSETVGYVSLLKILE
ncbi:YjbF family lipoprotein [Falsihalocynthiibacter sp. SS001]|uniref:YjbF family lipoprotein n=1 Tax=Falsihalocynthiibacter sp. SS001 TaxID=3349698 RepID=UPI0036D21266